MEPRYRAYGELDVQISRDEAPAIPYAYDQCAQSGERPHGLRGSLNPDLDLRGRLPQVMKRLVATGALVAVAALLLASAGGTHAIKEGGTFRVGMAQALLDSIDPAIVQMLGTSQLLQRTCASLAERRPIRRFRPTGLRLIPEIAADYPDVSRDGRTYTFTIRKGFRFTTGAPVGCARRRCLASTAS